MSKPPLVIYHANCKDGFCAAWVARRALPNAECYPAHYGQEPPPHIDGRRIYVLDFSYKRPVLEAMAQRAEWVRVLDHHKTAAEDLAGGEPVFASHYRTLARGLIVRFDMDKSGGRLAWEHFFPGMPAPWLVDYTEDRDLWRWKLSQSREVSAAIASHPADFALWDLWDAMPNNGPGILAEQGAAILRYQTTLVDQHVAAAVPVTIAGHEVLAVNATVLFSEIAGELAKDKPFGVAWFRRQDGKVQYSLRSREGGIDVSEVAKQFGGGGHQAAAGFENAEFPPRLPHAPLRFAADYSKAF